MRTMTPKKRLGRGLDALLSKPAPRVAAVTGDDAAGGDVLKLIPVELLQRGQYQPRVDMRQDSLEDLASSIKAQGVVQPIVARPIVKTGSTQRYEIVAGERRWRAAQLVGLAEIPTIIREVPDESAIAMALIENIQREDLNPLEEARALDRLIREFDLTHAEAASAVGRSRAAVSNLLRLLDLEDVVKEMVEQGKLEMGHARALLALRGAQQVEAARQVVNRGLTVRATEGLVKSLQRPPPVKPAVVKKDANIQHLETDLSDKLGASVAIRQGRGGKGKLEISYNSLDELDGILEHIQ